MRIVIVGDGKIGSALAEQLSREGHEITIIDRSGTPLQRTVEDLDILSVEGNGATYATQIENNFYNLYCQPRISQRQCSGIRVTVAAQDNNFVSTRTILVSIEILPSPNVDWVKVGVLYVSALS